MDAEELYEKVKHHPFEPFRVHVSGGSSYEICYPDQIVVGRRSSHVDVVVLGHRPNTTEGEEGSEGDPDRGRK